MGRLANIYGSNGYFYEGAHVVPDSGGSRIEALDAAQSFDFEAKAQAKLKEAERQKLRIGIIGFGNFGQFLAKRFLKQGHEVLATSRRPYEEVAAKLGVLYFRDVNDFCEEHPDVVILSTSIMSTEKVLGAIPMQRLRRNTLFVDVLSVKVFPKQLLLSRLHPQMDVLCTHPMFGPDSGKGSWEGLNFMYEKVRLLPGVQRERRINGFLQCFADEGCHMVEMTCEEHDRQSAGTQFITHTVGRILGEMNLQSTAINTKGFESLLSLVNNTTNDSFDLYYGLFMYNQNSTRELENMEQAFLEVKQKLFSELHATLRKEVFPSTPSPALPPSPASAADTAHGNGKAGAGGSGSGGEGADGASEGLQEAATADRGVAVEKR